MRKKKTDVTSSSSYSPEAAKPIEPKIAVETKPISFQEPTANAGKSAIDKLKEKIAQQKELEQNQVQVIDNNDEPTVENKPFTEASFTDAWNQYISLLENSGKSRISVFLKESPIKFLSEIKVEIELKSQLEKDTIEEERMEMIPMLRKQLQNFELDIVFTINKDRIVHLGKVSKSDQLKRMVEKNPNLGDFVQGLGLEIDY